MRTRCKKQERVLLSLIYRCSLLRNVQRKTPQMICCKKRTRKHEFSVSRQWILSTECRNSECSENVFISYTAPWHDQLQTAESLVSSDSLRQTDWSPGCHLVYIVLKASQFKISQSILRRQNVGIASMVGATGGYGE